MFSSDRIGGFGYGADVSVGIFLLITTITLASYFCTRAPVTTADRGGDNGSGGGGGDGHDVELGSDETSLMGHPEVMYGEARKEAAKGKKGTTCTCCSICLDNYGNGDVLRMLLECGHLFHRECVYTWLRQQPTCPVCPTSPMPSPMPTQLVEVTPLVMPRMS